MGRFPRTPLPPIDEEALKQQAKENTWLGLLVRLLAERSEGGYVLIRYGQKTSPHAPGQKHIEWRVNVRASGAREEVGSGYSLVAALERVLNTTVGRERHQQWVDCSCVHHAPKTAAEMAKIESEPS